MHPRQEQCGPNRRSEGEWVGTTRHVEEEKATALSRPVVPGEGDPCPRCRVPMQIREYSNLTDKHLHRPYFYTRWFCCMNKSCRTTLVMPERYKVVNPGCGGLSAI